MKIKGESCVLEPVSPGSNSQLYHFLPVYLSDRLFESQLSTWNVTPSMEHKFVLFPPKGAIIGAGIRAPHSFPSSYNDVGINLIKHEIHGKRVLELLDTEGKDGQRYITESFTVPTTKG